MRPARRKQRHQSEPLPPREQDSPDPFDQPNPVAIKNEPLSPAPKSAAATLRPSSRFPLDPQLREARDPGTGATVAFPLTPTSAVGEADRAMATGTPAITNDRCSPSDGLRAPELPASPVKMSDQATINDPSAFPPPSDVPVSNPSSANTARTHPSHANGSTTSSSSRTMSHRVENLPIRPRHFQDPHFHDTHAGHYYAAHPSPPPITTLTHSPSLSSDRSSVSSPAPTILPPLTHPSQYPSQAYSSGGAHRYASTAQPGAYHHSHYYPNTVAPPDVFTAPAQPYTHSYTGGYAPPPPTHVPFHHTTDMSISHSQQFSANPYSSVSPMYSHGGHGAGGGSGGFTPIYTDDASTKLSDRVRRRCFNCCTTDTSTWRRSSLNPGKVLCNKCGLFERTHSRPRPDQFPHKRAPLQIPSHNPAQHDVSIHAQSGPAQTPSQVQSPHVPALAAPHNLPPTTAHPSLGAAYSHPSALPQIQEWLRPNTGPTTAGSSTPSSGSAGPSRAASASSAGDRHQVASALTPASSAGASATNTSASTGGARPQNIGARLVKRSDSANSDMLGTPPPSRTTQNLTPSPSPPPDAVRSGAGANTTDSPRALPIGSGADTGNP